MAQRGHVPRFGDWNQDTAYTTCFDTARKEKAAGPQMINPNDPEQMAELHKPVFSVEPQYQPQYPNKSYRDKPMEYQQPKPNYGREEREQRGYGQTTPPHSRNTSHRANVEQRNQAGGHRSGGEPSYIPSQSPVNQGRTANARQGMPGRQRPTAVPKFGDWDAADPQASAGYTVIFNQVKEDKKAGAAVHIPQAPPRPPPSYADERAYQNDSFWSGLFPCLRPSVKD